MEFSKVGFKSNDVEIIQYPSGYAIIHVIVHRLLLFFHLPIVTSAVIPASAPSGCLSKLIVTS